MRLAKAVLSLLFFLGVIIIFKPPIDPDFGWHYKYGEYFVTTGKLLRNNVFSYTFPDYNWANSYWFSQAVLYIIYAGFGNVAAGLIFSSLLSFSAALYVRKLAKTASSGIGAQIFLCLMLFCAFSYLLVSVRPMLASVLLLMLLIIILLDQSKLSLWLLPLVFVIWANMHADFVVGLFMLGLFIGDRVVQTKSLSPKTIKTSILLGAGCIAATLINPFGLLLWRTLSQEANPGQFYYVGEWLPVFSRAPILTVVIYCGILGFFAYSAWSMRRRLPIWYLIALAVFIALSLRSQYFFRIAVILGIYAGLQFMAFGAESLSSIFHRINRKKVYLGIHILLIVFIIFSSENFIINIRQSVNIKGLAETRCYPREALDYALGTGFHGNMFNYYNWGGYIIWSHPDLKTFVDGRMPSWRQKGESVFEDYIKITSYPKENEALLDKYNIGWVIYPPNSKLADYLYSATSWKNVYSDECAVLFLRGK